MEQTRLAITLVRGIVRAAEEMFLYVSIEHTLLGALLEYYSELITASELVNIFKAEIGGANWRSDPRHPG